MEKGTKILDLILEYCLPKINDARLKDRAKTNEPLFANQCWCYLKMAIPEFNIPTFMTEYLVGTFDNPKIQEPIFKSYLYDTEEDITTKKELVLGDEFKDFELFNAVIRKTNNVGEVILLAVDNVSYDKDTGTITLDGLKQKIDKGTTFDFDFYTDGYFAERLNPQEQNILGKLFAYEWHRNLMSDVFNFIPLIEDKTFSTQNRANKQNADTTRLSALRQEVINDMRNYEFAKGSNKFNIRRFF